MTYAIDRLNTVDWLTDFLWRDPMQTLDRREHASYKETDGAVEISLDLPGVQKSDVKVTSEGNLLVIESKRGGSTSRKSYSLSREYDLLGTTATLDLGVLKLHVPKRSKNPPNVIEVK